MGIGAKKVQRTKESSIKLDVLENHFSLFFIQLLQIIDSGGSKYIPEFPGFSLSFRWSLAFPSPLWVGWNVHSVLTSGTKQQ